MIKIRNKKIIIIASILLTLLISVLVFTLLFNSSSHNADIDREEQVVEKGEEEVQKDIYNYKLSDSASLYEVELFNDLKLILSRDEVNDEEYAVGLAKVFVADLFTLSSKKGSSDVTSSQYVYTKYRDKYKILVKMVYILLLNLI